LQVELLNTRMQSMGLEPVTGPQSLEILLQDESNRQFLDDIRSRADISVDVTAELQTVRRRSREREQECLKLQQEIQVCVFHLGKWFFLCCSIFFLLLNLLTFVEAEDFLACMHSKPKRLPVCFFLISRVA
jgi:hypothetical protein